MQASCLASIALRPQSTARCNTSHVELQVILIPDLLFLAFLVYTARRCYDILNRSPSMIMWTYYCLVWAVTLANVLRTVIQLLSRRSGSVELWNVLWLLTRFIMTMLEVRTTHPALSVCTCLQVELHGSLSRRALRCV